MLIKDYDGFMAYFQEWKELRSRKQGGEEDVMKLLLKLFGRFQMYGLEAKKSVSVLLVEGLFLYDMDPKQIRMVIFSMIYHMLARGMIGTPFPY